MFTDLDRDMAKRGYVYYADSGKLTGFRKPCRNLDEADRARLVFDVPAYLAHGHKPA
jgi:hypothetical protein